MLSVLCAPRINSEDNVNNVDTGYQFIQNYV